MIKKLEIADDRRKHKGNLGNNQQNHGQKIGKKGIIKGNSMEQRIIKLHDHFSGLLGSEPPAIVELIDEDIEIILCNMNIDDGDFRIDEIQRAKLKLFEGKASEPGGIPPEVIKICIFDDIILKLCNKLLNENMIPEQWI